MWGLTRRPNQTRLENSKRINVQEAKTHLSRLIDAVAAMAASKKPIYCPDLRNSEIRSAN